MNEIVLILKSFMPAASVVHERWSRYKANRARCRIEKVQAYLGARVADIQESVRLLEQQPEDAGLFLATLDSLIQDDEDAKTGFYAAFLEHQLNGQTSREEMRLIAVAFRSLTFAELAALSRVTEEGRLPALHDADWLETMLPPRLTSFGLYIAPPRGVYGSRLTSLGLLARSIAIDGNKAFES